MWFDVIHAQANKLFAFRTDKPPHLIDLFEMTTGMGDTFGSEYSAENIFHHVGFFDAG